MSTYFPTLYLNSSSPHCLSNFVFSFHLIPGLHSLCLHIPHFSTSSHYGHLSSPHSLVTFSYLLHFISSWTPWSSPHSLLTISYLLHFISSWIFVLSSLFVNYLLSSSLHLLMDICLLLTLFFSYLLSSSLHLLMDICLLQSWAHRSLKSLNRSWANLHFGSDGAQSVKEHGHLSYPHSPSNSVSPISSLFHLLMDICPLLTICQLSSTSCWTFVYPSF